MIPQLKVDRFKRRERRDAEKFKTKYTQGVALPFSAPSAPLRPLRRRSCL